MNEHWKSWGVRQLTGTGFIYHGYVGRELGPESTCGHDHRKAHAAQKCSERLARKLNREVSP